jgi:hypothetical protein
MISYGSLIALWLIVYFVDVALKGERLRKEKGGFTESEVRYISRMWFWGYIYLIVSLGIKIIKVIHG